MMNQRIVLTGATGFLGSHLATALGWRAEVPPEQGFKRMIETLA